MFPRVVDGGTLSDTFSVTNGKKQRCVLAPQLFNIFYATMLIDALKHNDKGIQLQYKTNGGIFNRQRLRAKTKVANLLVRDFL